MKPQAWACVLAGRVPQAHPSPPSMPGLVQISLPPSVERLNATRAPNGCILHCMLDRSAPPRASLHGIACMQRRGCAHRRTRQTRRHPRHMRGMYERRTSWWPSFWQRPWQLSLWPGALRLRQRLRQREPERSEIDTRSEALSACRYGQQACRLEIRDSERSRALVQRTCGAAVAVSVACEPMPPAAAAAAT